MTPGAAFREVLARPGCAMAVGSYDPAVAKLVERAGFPVVYVSGSGASLKLSRPRSENPATDVEAPEPLT